MKKIIDTWNARVVGDHKTKYYMYEEDKQIWCVSRATYLDGSKNYIRSVYETPLDCVGTQEENEKIFNEMQELERATKNNEA